MKGNQRKHRKSIERVSVLLLQRRETLDVIWEINPVVIVDIKA